MLHLKAIVSKSYPVALLNLQPSCIKPFTKTLSKLFVPLCAALRFP